MMCTTQMKRTSLALWHILVLVVSVHQALAGTTTPGLVPVSGAANPNSPTPATAQVSVRDITTTLTLLDTTAATDLSTGPFAASDVSSVSTFLDSSNSSVDTPDATLTTESSASLQDTSAPVLPGSNNLTGEEPSSAVPVSQLEPTSFTRQIPTATQLPTVKPTNSTSTSSPLQTPITGPSSPATGAPENRNPYADNPQPTSRLSPAVAAQSQQQRLVNPLVLIRSGIPPYFFWVPSQQSNPGQAATNPALSAAGLYLTAADFNLWPLLLAPPRSTPGPQSWPPQIRPLQPMGQSQRSQPTLQRQMFPGQNPLLLQQNQGLPPHIQHRNNMAANWFMWNELY